MVALDADVKALVAPRWVGRRLVQNSPSHHRTWSLRAERRSRCLPQGWSSKRRLGWNGVRTTYAATTAGMVEHHETSLIDAARMEPAASLRAAERHRLSPAMRYAAVR